MANDKCDICGDEPVVTIMGITHNFNLCQIHIAPPYDMVLIKDIINEIKVDTVVSFLTAIHDRIKQEEKIVEVEEHINELIKHTKLDSLNKITKERDAGIKRIKELEALLESQKEELAAKDETIKKTTTLKQSIDKMQMQLSGEMASQTVQILGAMTSESQNIVSQLKPEISTVDKIDTEKAQHNPKKRRRREEQEETTKDEEVNREEEDSAIGEEPETEQ